MVDTCLVPMDMQAVNTCLRHFFVLTTQDESSNRALKNTRGI